MEIHTRPLKRTMADGSVSGAGVSLVEEAPGIVLVRVPFLGGGWMAHDVLATGELSAAEVREAWGESHNPDQIKELWDKGALHTTCQTKQEATEALGKYLEQPTAEQVLGELID